jgi:hypothetical protein
VRSISCAADAELSCHWWQPLTDYLALLWANDDANAYIFPRAASAKGTASLSNQFREILADAGLIQPRSPSSETRPLTNTRGKRDFVPLVAPLCGDDAQSVRTLRRVRARDRRTRKRRSLTPIHASHDGRQASRHEAVAGRNERLNAVRVSEIVRKA